ncbi:MAG: HEAT repeat domain-containing protein [Methanomicrobiaceae archaeon]|nr:HEAT repeat domain-containing protein [Methanomicrobiaceae archaeon]
MDRRYTDHAEMMRARRERRTEENFEKYLEQLKDPGIPYRVKAAEILGEFGDLRAVPHLLECVKNETDSGVLYVCVCSLGKLGDSCAVMPLILLLKHDDRWVRRGAAKSLGMIGKRDAIPHILPMLGDLSPKIRASAAEALGMMSYWDVVDDIIPLLDDEDTEVRTAAKKAVRMLGRGDLADQ